jgi:glycosyltransferase involved in cell wall biosynthesis
MNSKNSAPILNLWNIKRPNGMYHYGLDYIRAVGGEWLIFVRPGFPGKRLELQPGWQVYELSIFELIRTLWVAGREGRFIFCPSPHPVPILSRQLIVVHDSYPFRNLKGWVKKILFKWSLRSSSCHVAYINHADALAFVQRMGVAPGRTHFMPNIVDRYTTRKRHGNRLCGPDLRVGLIGTDSPKKNHESLFGAVINLSLSKNITFWVYGLHTPYFNKIKTRFDGLKINLVDSEVEGLADFFRKIDVLVSVAKGEGFSRPIASALVDGLPCILIDDPVFREFYDGYARFGAAPEAVLKLATSVRGEGAIFGVIDGKNFPPESLTMASGKATAFLVQCVKGGGVC